MLAVELLFWSGIVFVPIIAIILNQLLLSAGNCSLLVNHGLLAYIAPTFFSALLFFGRYEIDSNS